MKRLSIIGFTLVIAACAGAPEETEDTATTDAELSLPRVGIENEVTNANGNSTGCWDLPLPSMLPSLFQQSRCNGDDNQLWFFERVSTTDPSIFRIRSKFTNACLFMRSPVASGTQVGITWCGSGQDQHWIVVPESNGVYATVHSRLLLSLCMNVRGAVAGGTAPIDAVTCNGSASQAFQFGRFMARVNDPSCQGSQLYRGSGTPTVQDGQVQSMWTTSDDVATACFDTTPPGPGLIDCPTGTNRMVINRFTDKVTCILR